MDPRLGSFHLLKICSFSGTGFTPPAIVADPSSEPTNVYGAPIKSNIIGSAIETESMETNPEAKVQEILIESELSPKENGNLTIIGDSSGPSELSPKENGNLTQTGDGPESNTFTSTVQELGAITTASTISVPESSAPDDRTFSQINKTETRKPSPAKPKKPATLYGAPKPAPALYGAPKPVSNSYGAPVSNSEELALPVYVTPKPPRKQLKTFKAI